MVLGSIAGSAGVLNVNDADADFLITGAASDMTVGGNGTGTLNITGTGLVRVADQFIAGNNSTAVATVSISGFSVGPLGVSELEVLRTSQSRIGQCGDATMTITNGGAADFAGDLVIANGSASVSTVTVEDIGLLPSRLNVAGDLLVARNTSASIAEGDGTLNVQGHVVTFETNPTLAGTVHVDGGSLGTDGSAVEITSVLHGPGAIVGDLVTSAQFSGGAGEVHPDGTLNVIGDPRANTPSADGLIRVTVNGSDPSEFERIFVNGVATLGDQLIIDAPANLDAAIGDQMQIIAATSGRVGEFENVVGEKIDGTRAFQVLYRPSGVVLRVLAFQNGHFACDANCDGSIHQFDIIPFVDTLTSGGGCAANTGDTNANGTTNAFDINGFIARLTLP